MKKNQNFYAKILLFGEYSILCDSMGLTIPYGHFNGELSFINEDKYTDYDFAVNSNELLRDYLSYIRERAESGELKCDFDIDAFARDVQNSLYFESTIPQGYGVGSSGALTAALYDRYVRNKIPAEGNPDVHQIQQLKEIFAILESYFHGTSSGIDPLNCYLKHPLLIKNKSEICTVGIPRHQHEKDGAIFLINTGNPGKTGPLVNQFMEKCRQSDFLDLLKQELIFFNDNCIKALIKGETRRFFSNLKLLSKFLLQHFKPMIPKTFEKVWQHGLDTGAYYLKLCGSGGGGFLLGFAEDFERAKAILQEYQLEVIPVYKS
ncbi:MAG: hypothetical protein K9I94_09945 [Bacteroidales bacterium]|nr:hypothetical protein [Bacteroidales bacterium]